MSTSVRRPLAAALVAAAGVAVLAAGPVAAHNPRETPASAPRMDLEVMVTPELEGRITPGGTDPLVSVDAFGNRFAVARKEDAQRAVGVDQRARTATRTAAWAWTSRDDGLTWENLETVPRGGDALLPQGTGRDLASGGALTLLAEHHGAAVVVTRTAAVRRGQLVGQPPAVVPTPGAAPGSPAIATDGERALLAVPLLDGGTATHLSADAGATWTAGPTLAGSCDVALGAAALVACHSGDDVVLHTSRDGGASYAPRRIGAVDTRTASDRPQVDVAPDGTVHVLSGLRLTRVRGARLLVQDLQVLPGEHRGAAFAVSNRGRIAAAVQHRAAPSDGWHVLVALFDAGRPPVWYDFADHDPLTPAGAADPPATAVSIDTDPQGRLQLVWSATFLHSAELGRPLLRNVFTARSVTS